MEIEFEEIKKDNGKELISELTYISYVANRGYGMSHKQLTRIGIGNDAMKERYEKEIQKTK